MTYRHFSVFLLVMASLLGWSCERNTLTVPSTPVPAGARIKLVHAAPDAPGVNLFINNEKISAAIPTGAISTSAGTGTPAPITFGSTFPGVSANYAIVTSGQVSVSLTAPATTTATSPTTVYAQSLTLDDNKYYSLLLMGTGPQPEVQLLNDDFSSATDPNKFYVRFVNLIPGATAYDLLLSDGTKLVSNVTYKTVSPFVGVDIKNNASFLFRVAGATANVTTALTYTGTTSGRVLTVFAQGVVGKTGTQAPKLTAYVNR
ncbi:DUF4397 domain-containing protein [Spirosoma fluminis]